MLVPLSWIREFTPVDAPVEVFLFDLTARDPVTLGVAAGILVVTCTVAAYLPARRATRIEPAAALRVD